MKLIMKYKNIVMSYDIQRLLRKKITVEANTALLSLKTVKGSKLPDDGAALTQERPEFPNTWTETTKQWDQNDSSRMFRARNCPSLFRQIVIPLELGIVKPRSRTNA